MDRENSAGQPVQSDFQQGTVMGSLSIYINKNMTSNVRFFADKCTIYRKIRNDNDAAFITNRPKTSMRLYIISNEIVSTYQAQKSCHTKSQLHPM